MPTRDLPVRANLENLRKQAKALHRAFLDGDADAVQRIRDNLPRAEALSDQDLRAHDLSLQEAQHVLAKEYGLASWDDLKAALSTAGFDDLARLNDRETQTLLREISQLDLSRSLVGAPKAVRGRMLTNMSRRVRTFITEEIERLSADLPDHEPAASRQRLLEWAELLARNGRITWPPAADARAWEGDEEEGGIVKGEDPTGGRDLEELSIDDLAGFFAELEATALREGILALDDAATARSPLQEGLRLTVDGTEPELIEAILARHTETMVRNRRMRLRMFLDGVEAIQEGDNPWIIHQKMQVHYLDAGVTETPQRVNEAMTADEMREWLERGWLTTRTPADIADLFLHLGFSARNEGIAPLGKVLELVEPSFLRQALTLMVENRQTARLQEEMAPHMERELAELEGRLRAISAGVMGIARRLQPEEVAEAARRAGA